MLNKHQLNKYYNHISIIPVKARSKDPKDKYWAYKRYTINDIKSDENIAICTGTEVFRNRFSVVLDVDFDMSTPLGEKVLKIISKYCNDTVIVKTGGKHNGMHVYYLVNSPVSSGNIMAKHGMIEIKGIDETGRPSIMQLPPSIVQRKYQVIHPQVSDYINFKQVKVISTNELTEKLKTLKVEILKI